MPEQMHSESPAPRADLRDQVIVGFDENLGAFGFAGAMDMIDTALAGLAEFPVTLLKRFVAAASDKSAFFALAVVRIDDPTFTIAGLQKALETDKKRFAGIAWVERNAAIALCTFNDAYFRWQWALDKLEATGPWQLPAPPPPPPTGQGNPPRTLVAIVDSGLRLPDGTVHADLGSVEPLADCQPAGFFPDGVDMDGHGTRLAGTIAAVSNNAIGIASATPSTWHISLLPVKFFDAGGSPDVANAAIAIAHAVDKGAKVINASWHVALGDHDKQALRRAIKYAKDKGRLVVAAAGNDGTDNALYPTYPANYGSVNLFPGLRQTMLTVAASAHDDFKASFSNYGPTLVDMAAPGTSITTTGRYLPGYTPKYPAYSGTSASTAFVSAAAALVFALNPGWTPKEVIEHLKASADAIDGLKAVCDGGRRLNLRRAVYGPLQITAPLLGASLGAGANTNITWMNEYTNPSFNKVKIEFSKDDGVTYTTVPTAASTNNDGLFTWKPLTTDKTPTGRLRITPVKGNFPVVSGQFRVV